VLYYDQQDRSGGLVPVEPVEVKRRCEMGRIGLAIRLMLVLPPVWITLATMVLAVVINGWGPGADIARYAAWRLLP
jgi:hypothetical protein